MNYEKEIARLDKRIDKEIHRRKKHDAVLYSKTDRLDREAIALNEEMEELEDKHDKDFNNLDDRVTDMEGEPPGKILTGFTMMKIRLLQELGDDFLKNVPASAEEAKADVKKCRDAIADYYDNVNTNWHDADTRHGDAFYWYDPEGAPIGSTNEKIIDFALNQEALIPIYDPKAPKDKLQWQEVE